eukprot:tig00001574_g9353.t1
MAFLSIVPASFAQSRAPAATSAQASSSIRHAPAAPRVAVPSQFLATPARVFAAERRFAANEGGLRMMADKKEKAPSPPPSPAPQEGQTAGGLLVFFTTLMLFLVGLGSTSARMFLSDDMLAPAPIEEQAPAPRK